MNKEQKMPEEISLKTRLLNILYSSLTFAVLLWITMVNFYLGNSEELMSTLAEVTVVSSALSVFLFFCVALVQLAFVKTRYFYGVNLTLVVLTIFLFIQSNVFVWPVDSARFAFISVYTHPGPSVIEILFYVVAIGAVCWKKAVRDFLFSNEFKISFILIGALLVGFCMNVRNSDESFFQTKWEPNPDEIVCGNKHSELLPTEKFQVSDKSSVIFIIIDSYGEDYFEDTLKFPDSKEREQFKDFQHFTHFISPFPRTMRALPMLLTGNRLFEAENSCGYFRMLSSAYGQGDCLLTRLSENGYKNHVVNSFCNQVYPCCPKLIANAAFKESTGKYVFSNVLMDFVVPHCAYLLSPVILKKTVYDVCNDFTWKAYDIYCSVSSGTPATANSTTAKQESPAEPVVKREPVPECFKGKPGLEKEYYKWRDFYYAQDAFFLNLQKADFEKVDTPMFNIVHMWGVHNYFKIVQDYTGDGQYSRDYYIHESRYFNEKVNEFCQNLKELGVYDNSYIIVMGDHGNHWEPEARRYNPMLLIKKPGQTGESLTDNDEVILMRDIAPTILKDLGLPAVNPLSIWNLTPEEKAERQEYWKRLMVDKK